MEAKAIETG